MLKTRILTAIGMTAFAGMLLAIGCTKGTTPIPPPVHDTIPVHDTTTIYKSIPDSIATSLKNGLLVYLPFSGNAGDSSGNNNPTQSVGNVLAVDAHGYANNAFNATGNGERVYVTNNGSIKFDSAFTVSFSYMVNSNKVQTYVSMVDPTTGNSPSFIIGNTLPAVPAMFDMGIGDASVGCSSPGQIDAYSIVDSANWLPTPAAWYNLVAVYNKGKLDVYINGKLLVSRQSLGNKVVCCPNSKIIIGSWWDGNPGNQSMDGKMDNFRLYGRAISSAEIAYLSQNYQVNSNSVKPGIKTVH